ncbi:putative NADPH-dependent methylglyoxal reductase GRP2 [Venustampulla echinocandica]|uniref:Putative NADPH-dependent methylglyoxal reductase GRP2 n=1 Tax=Venustampulla echinocandica TaxID=2656787 RepID=A0A370TS11_9HELO|nr:putative NADPH-dependent methylglyoxal reductase GRP2 [Venustampulla echinocandica]RDL38294.1 putative NADPH-dependent methylglyoxal reductase GRP2 [Venustampulla echinocandica]
MKVFLSGGSGFIAAHVLDILLEQGHTVITSVRSEDKASKIRAAHPKVPESQLSFRIVEDIAQEGAFDEAIKASEGLEGVIHTASPFHFNVTDTKKDLIDPAVIGTTGILKAIKKYAPGVKRVVITSSFASIYDATKGNTWDHTYSEKDWNPVTEAEALENPSNGYRASKTFAEKAAWEFLEKEKPNFTIATVCPPLVFGPVVHYLNDLKAINTSNARIRDAIEGKWTEGIPETGVYIWTDVRDLALAHVRALERPEAANKRFFVTAGYFSNRVLANIIRKNYPKLADKLPGDSVQGGDYPEGGQASVYKTDNSRTREVLGIEFRSLESSIVDLVKSLLEVGLKG